MILQFNWPNRQNTGCLRETDTIPVKSLHILTDLELKQNLFPAALEWEEKNKKRKEEGGIFFPLFLSIPIMVLYMTSCPGCHDFSTERPMSWEALSLRQTWIVGHPEI